MEGYMHLLILMYHMQSNKVTLAYVWSIWQGWYELIQQNAEGAHVSFLESHLWHGVR